MSHFLRRTARSLRRPLRPVMVLSLVLAQCVTTFGYPVVVRAGDAVRRCGCKVRGPSETCCCGAGSCCAGLATQAIPEPEPEPLTCPKCQVKQVKQTAKATPTAPKSKTVRWLATMNARSCSGDNSSAGLMVEFPAISPHVSSPSFSQPTSSGIVRASDDHLISHFSIPPDPPPRRG